MFAPSVAGRLVGRHKSDDARYGLFFSIGLGWRKSDIAKGNHDGAIEIKIDLLSYFMTVMNKRS